MVLSVDGPSQEVLWEVSVLGKDTSDGRLWLWKSRTVVHGAAAWAVFTKIHLNEERKASLVLI